MALAGADNTIVAKPLPFGHARRTRRSSPLHARYSARLPMVWPPLHTHTKGDNAVESVRTRIDDNRKEKLAYDDNRKGPISTVLGTKSVHMAALSDIRADNKNAETATAPETSTLEPANEDAMTIADTPTPPPQPELKPNRRLEKLSRLIIQLRRQTPVPTAAPHVPSIEMTIKSEPHQHHHHQQQQQQQLFSVGPDDHIDDLGQPGHGTIVPKQGVEDREVLRGVLGGAVSEVVDLEGRRQSSRTLSFLEERLQRELSSVSDRLSFLEKAAATATAERGKLREEAEQVASDEAYLCVRETIDFLVLSVEEKMATKEHTSAEDWARQEVERLTKELEVERTARNALEGRLAALETEMQRDEREWRRTLQIGAALSSSSSTLPPAPIAASSAADPRAATSNSEESNSASTLGAASAATAATAAASNSTSAVPNSEVSRHMDGLFPPMPTGGGD